MQEIILEKHPILTSATYQKTMANSVKEVLFLLLKENKEFQLNIPKNKLSFEPALDKVFMDSFQELVLFDISGYPLETFAIDVEEDEFNVTFESGFGDNPSGPTLVSFDLYSIYNILVEFAIPLIINTSALVPIERVDSKALAKSFDVFSSNPENAQFFKDKEDS